MKEVHNDELVRLSLKAGLTSEEESRLEAWLAAHPEARTAWEEDRALGRALQALPDAPLASNFTARVLQAVDLEESRVERGRRAPERSWLRVFWPRLGWAAVVALLTVVVVHENRVAKRTQLVRDVTFVSEDVAKLPAPEVLGDFDAITQLRQATSGSDDELLIALQ